MDEYNHYRTLAGCDIMARESRLEQTRSSLSKSHIMNNHGPSFRALFPLIVACSLALTGFGGCSQGEKPLPSVFGVQVERGEGDLADRVLVTWDASTDSRVEGYAIYRAEEGLGSTPGEKSEYVLQAVTFATQYNDEEVHTTELYPSIMYYYQITVIAEDGSRGPMSEEVSVEYSPAS